MSTWTEFLKTSVTEMRPYVPGENMDKISVSDGDTPSVGGMIARNLTDHSDQWYVAEKYFKNSYVQK